ncbi:MAG: ATP-grasp domain-containing protein [Deltaproteobacteria bacterium]|nr:ATP-grasp domain-containing protein [Deltaproteobacteria bacterium]
MIRSRKKRILVLGAGLFQISGIQKAVNLGYEVITLDNKPENIGHALSHQSIHCSTVEIDRVYQYARVLNIDAICTFASDAAIPTVSYICDRLNLPGVSHDVAVTMTLKHLFRQFMHNHCLPHPDFVVAAEVYDVMDYVRQMDYPLILKPVDSSGSRGVFKLNEYEGPIFLKKMFNEAKRYSRLGQVCIEEFIDGVEVGGDGFLLQGRFKALFITQKYMNDFVVTGHRLPTNIEESDKLRVISALEQCCRAIGYSDGPLNFDVIAAPQSVYIIEMSPRTGGNGIPQLIEYASGADLEAATIKMAFNEKIDIPLHGNMKGCGSLVYGNSKSGYLRNIASRRVLKEKIEEIFFVHTDVHIGQPVDAFEHNGNSMGFVLFSCRSHDEYKEIQCRIRHALAIEVV